MNVPLCEKLLPILSHIILKTFRRFHFTEEKTEQRVIKKPAQGDTVKGIQNPPPMTRLSASLPYCLLI